MNRIFRSLPVIAILIAVFSCSRPSQEMWDEVARAGALADFNPDSALAVLDSIAPFVDRSNEKISMFYELIRYKASDKADIPIMSDSIITPILEYYKDRSDDTLSAVALYYGGRTYSELGDAPRALDYFQKALDRISPGADIRQASFVHSQISQIYAKQGFYELALDEDKIAFEYTSLLNDTAAIIHDLTSLAESCWTLLQCDSAQMYLDRAYELSKYLDEDKRNAFVPRLKANFAYKMDKIDLAKKYIEEALSYKMSPHEKQLVFSSAASIYSKDDKARSISYLRWLCDSGNVKVRKFAHKEMVNIIMETEPNDSLSYHLNEMLRCIDTVDYYNSLEAIAKAKAVYDYRLRENENKTLALKSTRLQRNIMILGLVLVVLVVIILSQITRYRKQKIFFSSLRLDYENRERQTKVYEQEIYSLKQELANREKQDDSITCDVGENLFSEYPIVIKFIDSKINPEIKYNSQDWQDLENVLKNKFPNFYLKLRVNNALSEIEWRVTMLVKIGVSPNQISRITNKSSSSITSIRARLYKKTFGTENASAKDWDELVRSL